MNFVSSAFTEMQDLYFRVKLLPATTGKMESCRMVNLTFGLFMCKLNEFQPDMVLPCSSLPGNSCCVHASHSILTFSCFSYCRYNHE